MKKMEKQSFKNYNEAEAFLRSICCRLDGTRYSQALKTWGTAGGYNPDDIENVITTAQDLWMSETGEEDKTIFLSMFCKNWMNLDKNSSKHNKFIQGNLRVGSNGQPKRTVKLFSTLRNLVSEARARQRTPDPKLDRVSKLEKEVRDMKCLLNKLLDSYTDLAKSIKVKAPEQRQFNMDQFMGGTES